jgi:uncharacterized protein (DUF2384 family)
MPKVGVEPTRPEGHRILSPARLPIPPLRRATPWYVAPLPATPGLAQHNSLRNTKRCANLRGMAVAIAAKVDALRVDFGSSARLADMLGVSRAQVTRWLRGSGIDPLNAEKVDLLELVWSNLLRLYEREAALAWLFGLNPVLGDRRPIDLIREGRTEELMRAIRAERSDSFA